MDILVVGAGEMGRWAADTLDADLTFTDVDPAVAEDAAATRTGADAIDPIDPDGTPGRTLPQFDAVCFAVPITAIEPSIETYTPLATDAVFDLAGVMDAPIAAMRSHADALERASFHPLFAPPRAPGNIAAVLDSPGPTIERVIDGFEAAHNRVFETTVEEHDRAMETVQAGAHAAILAFGLAAEDVREEFSTPVSTGLNDLLETVTEGSPSVYAEIQSTFEGADRVAEAATEIAEADDETFERLYEAAGRNTRSRDRHE